MTLRPFGFILRLALIAAACASFSACTTLAVSNRAAGKHFLRPKDPNQPPPPPPPNPFFYALIPLTVPVDIVTAPIQLIVLSNQDMAP